MLRTILYAWTHRQGITKVDHAWEGQGRGRCECAQFVEPGALFAGRQDDHIVSQTALLETRSRI